MESRILDFREVGLNNAPNSGDSGGRKKRKVRFNFDDSQESSTTASSPTTTQDRGPVDLRASQNFCTVLQGTSVYPWEPKCLGYLDSCCNEAFRHSFFGVAAPSPISKSICVTTKEILSRPTETSVTLVDQLTLARSFAMAILKFHSTPWLGDYVTTIQDFSFFSSDDSDLSSCIQTAHLGFDFVHSSSRDNFPSEDMIDREAVEDAKLAHGIRNLTLWGLGTVMYVPFENPLSLQHCLEGITIFKVRSGAHALVKDWVVASLTAFRRFSFEWFLSLFKKTDIRTRQDS